MGGGGIEGAGVVPGSWWEKILGDGNCNSRTQMLVGSAWLISHLK